MGQVLRREDELLKGAGDLKETGGSGKREVD